jgi:ribosomal protein S18 acetylase RimI-like enzyme
LLIEINHMIQIVDYDAAQQPYFEKFNKAWIEAAYELEEVDRYVLEHPGEAILQKGGVILMALFSGQVAGTVALKKMDDITFEFTKMAVDVNFRRKGIGNALCYASFEKARALGAEKIVLYSNTLQEAAIKMYEKIGFLHQPVESGVYKRANVKMCIQLN